MSGKGYIDYRPNPCRMPCLLTRWEQDGRKSEAKFGIPVIYASQYKPLAEEKAASWLSKHFTS